MRFVEPIVPSELMNRHESGSMATVSARAAFSAFPCYDAVADPEGVLLFVNKDGALCGSIVPELLALFTEEC